MTFCRVVFGLKSSPFLLNATLRHHISKYNDLHPEFVLTVLESFYVVEKKVKNRH